MYFLGYCTGSNPAWFTPYVGQKLYITPNQVPQLRDAELSADKEAKWWSYEAIDSTGKKGCEYTCHFKLTFLISTTTLIAFTSCYSRYAAFISTCFTVIDVTFILVQIVSKSASHMPSDHFRWLL
jgi:hypothetical protein